MKTIQTKPDCTLGFVSFMPDVRIANTYISGYSFKPGIVANLVINEETITARMIGKLTEITEDQAKELVAFYSGEDKGKGYKDYDTKRPEWYEYASNSLLSAAEEVGIPETDFDKYFVIEVLSNLILKE